MMILKFSAVDCGSLRRFLSRMVEVSNDFDNPASKIWNNISYTINKFSGKPNFCIVRISMEHLFPSVMWKFGFVLLFFSLFWVWLLIPALILFLFRLVDTPFFFFLLLRKGLKKQGYNGPVRRL